MNSPPDGWDATGSPYFLVKGLDIVIFPMATDISRCKEAGLVTGGQCGRAEDQGAFTGDIPMRVLKELGCTHVLCGHSDRREHHGETDECIGKQVEAAIENGITPILCIGETAEEHTAQKTKEVLKRQLTPLLTFIEKAWRSPNLLRAGAAPLPFMLAYEPVWAISRGDPTKPSASAQDAQKVHAFIRSLLPEELRSLRIIYGGSMKGSNAEELLSQPDIDGGLVGGASLKPADFATIVAAAKKSEK